MGQINHEDLSPKLSKILKDSDGVKEKIEGINSNITNVMSSVKEINTDVQGIQSRREYWDSVAYRYKETCTLISDWNLAIQNGMYMASNALNAPNESWYMGTVIVHNDQWIEQKIVALSDTLNEYRRFKLSGTWGAWELVYQVGDKTKLDLTRSFRTDSNSSSDPNTNAQENFLTNHASVQNAGESGLFWYVQQGYWSGTNNRYQIATRYNSTGDMKTRNCYEGTWSAWSPSLQTLFNSVSNGKTLIANAITQIGTSTSATSEFATMASNITTTVNTAKTQIANVITNRGVSTSTSATFATMASNISTIPPRYNTQYFTRQFSSSQYQEVDFVVNAGFPVKYASIICHDFKVNYGNYGTGVIFNLDAAATAYRSAGGITDNTTSTMVAHVFNYLVSLGGSYGLLISGNYVYVRLTYYGSVNVATQTVGITVQTWG